MEKSESVNNPENSSESLEIQKAHVWTREHLESIKAGLKEAHEETAAHIKEIDRMYDGELGSVFENVAFNSEDYFSCSLCNMLVKRFPETELGTMKKIFGVAEFDKKKNKYIRNSSGKIEAKEYSEKVTIDHAFFMDGNVIVDPTAGQFFSLDAIMKEMPDLFEDRVLIITPERAQSELKVKYGLTRSST